jgi:hypothetical protein
MIKVLCLRYHGVPKIFLDNNLENVMRYDFTSLNENYLKSEHFVNDDEWFKVYEYLKINRLNLNIRQVHF